MWNLRRDGLTLAEVGELENTDKTVVCRAIQRMFKRELPPDLEEQRALENARLDFVWAKMMPLLDDADAGTRIRAATACMRISARRAALNGLDAPVKAPVGPDGRPVPAQITVIYEDRPMPPIIDVTNVSDSHQIAQTA